MGGVEQGLYTGDQTGSILDCSLRFPRLTNLPGK